MAEQGFGEQVRRWALRVGLIKDHIRFNLNNKLFDINKTNVIEAKPKTIYLVSGLNEKINPNKYMNQITKLRNLNKYNLGDIEVYISEK